MAMIDYDNYNPLDVYGNPEFPTTYEEEEDFHAVFTVQLGELIHDGVINFHDGSWINMPEKFQSGGIIKWYNADQRERFWNKFQARFFWREIGELPIYRWKWDILSKLLSLMPQYYEMYKLIDQGLSPLQIAHEFGITNASGNRDGYGKKRDVFSDFPQTQLGDNQDYASSGSDNEYEDIMNSTSEKSMANTKHGGFIDTMNNLHDRYRDIDLWLLNEFDSNFYCVLSSNINGY